MGVPCTFLFLWLALDLRLGYCLSDFHGILTDDELYSYTKKEHIKEYEIILPKIHDPSKMSKRSIDSINQNEPQKVTFTAFKEEHHVHLERNQWLLRPGLEVEYLQPDGSFRKEPVQTRDCHFFATSISHGGSKGALSTCNGLRGVLSVDDEMLFIEPLKEDHARRMRRDSDDTIHPHLIYKRDVSDGEDPLCPDGNFRVADNGGSIGTVTLANETVYTGPYLGAKYVEIFYVVDKLVYDEHLTETESYATTILNIMSRRFADPSLDISIRFSVVRLLISMTTTITAINPSGGEESITPDAVADTTLPNFCTWQAALSVDDDTNPNDWDLALLFTGHDIYRDNMIYSLLGRARLGGTCDVSNKCSVTENSGLSAGLTMAHETGHSLGVQHDGTYGCTEGLNIMSTSLSRSTGTFEWSSCSSEHMKMFISSEVCMDDIPTSILAAIVELPGQNFTENEQCQMVMGNPDAFICPSFTSCTKLSCGIPGDSSCYSSSVPAEGTPCGDGMWCINAECVSISAEISPAVNGGWTEFSNDFTSCSRSCGTGVQYRSRSCTNPTPQWGGEPCVGDSHIYRICNVEPCATSEDDYRNEQCAATNSIPFNGILYSWTDYQHSSIVGDELCWKSCLTTGETGSFRNDRPGNFNDGTLCWYEPVTDVAKSFEFTKSLCLNGRCRQNFGCDGVLDSGLVYDDCHICNGDGSSCSCTSETLTSVLTTGESVIATIPIGSTSISADSYGSNHFLGLSVNGTFIFGIDTSNGNTLTLSGEYKVGNMVVAYDRIFQVETHLRSLTEPSEETLDILLYTSTRNSNNVTYRYCTPVIDPCDAAPCQNGGVCTSADGAYTCSCPDTHQGTNCETEIDPCNAAPCQNGGVCTSADGAYTCSCPDTHQGTNCETEIDPCDAAPCQNGGVCTSAGSAYTCSCPDTHQGTNCETEIDPCDAAPCQNGGVCTSASVAYTCSCPDTHQGTNCETEIDPCDAAPCQNGGVCTSASSGYTCSCPDTHQGTNCETEIDPCDAAPCQNGGVCTSADGAYTCSCPNTHQGTNCETEIDPCDAAPCQNGGVCTSAGGAYTCSCPDTHQGTNCETEIDPCDAVPCQNGGVCTSADSAYTCSCPNTHQGTNCETEIDPCDAAPCQNGGVCSSSNSVYLCQCPDTHEGSNCEIAKSICSVTECDRRETCNPDTNTCECNGNQVRMPDGQCRRPRTTTLFFAIVIIDDITSFEDIVNNPESPNALAIRQRIILMLFGIYRRQYGILFVGIAINTIRLGSLEISADIMYDDADNATDMETPTPDEVAGVFTENLLNDNSTYGITVDPTRTVAFDKDECSNSTLNDCSPDAECTNTVGSYNCTCLPGYTDTTPTGSEPGTQCEANGLSYGTIIGLAVGSVSIVLLITILSICSLVAMRRMMYRRRLAAMSSTKIGMIREVRPDYGQKGYRSSMGDHRSDMEMGSMHKAGSDDGAYYSGAYDNRGFIRGYLATGKNGSARGKYY